MNTLSDKLRDEMTRLKNILNILKKFPDLKEETDEYGRTYLVSQQGIMSVTNVDFVYSCVCCDGASLVAMPYLEIEKIKIYGDPRCHVIGRRSGNFLVADPMYRKKLSYYFLRHIMDIIDGHVIANSEESPQNFPALFA